MKELFTIIFIGTFILTRVLAHKLHDRVDDSKSKTLTRKIREKTNFDFHHIHFGIIGVILSLFLYLIFGVFEVLIVIFAISLSLILDQIIPSIYHYNIIKSKNRISYFSLKSIVYAIILHLVVISLF